MATRLIVIGHYSFEAKEWSKCRLPIGCAAPQVWQLIHWQVNYQKAHHLFVLTFGGVAGVKTFGLYCAPFGLWYSEITCKDCALLLS